MTYCFVPSISCRSFVSEACMASPTFVGNGDSHSKQTTSGTKRTPRSACSIGYGETSSCLFHPLGPERQNHHPSILPTPQEAARTAWSHASLPASGLAAVKPCFRFRLAVVKPCHCRSQALFSVFENSRIRWIISMSCLSLLD